MTSHLYTVSRSDGDGRQFDLTVAEAADAILSHDGGQWEIRPGKNEDGFDLWTKSLNRDWTKSVIFSLAETEDAAKAEIAQAVVDQSPTWRGGLHAESMESYTSSLIEA